MKLADTNGLVSIDFTGNFIHNKCYKQLSQAVSKVKVCSICKKAINRWKSMLVDKKTKVKLVSYLQKEEVMDTLYLEKIHKSCEIIISKEETTNLSIKDNSTQFSAEMGEASTSMLEKPITNITEDISDMTQDL